MENFSHKFGDVSFSRWINEDEKSHICVYSDTKQHRLQISCVFDEANPKVYRRSISHTYLTEHIQRAAMFISPSDWVVSFLPCFVNALLSDAIRIEGPGSKEASIPSSFESNYSAKRKKAQSQTPVAKLFLTYAVSRQRIIVPIELVPANMSNENHVPFIMQHFSVCATTYDIFMSNWAQSSFSQSKSQSTENDTNSIQGTPQFATLSLAQHISMNTFENKAKISRVRSVSSESKNAFHETSESKTEPEKIQKKGDFSKRRKGRSSVNPTTRKKPRATGAKLTEESQDE